MLLPGPTCLGWSHMLWHGPLCLNWSDIVYRKKHLRREMVLGPTNSLSSVRPFVRSRRSHSITSKMLVELRFYFQCSISTSLVLSRVVWRIRKIMIWAMKAARRVPDIQNIGRNWLRNVILGTNLVKNGYQFTSGTRLLPLT